MLSSRAFEGTGVPDTWPLAPLQQGMVADSILTGDPGLNVEQIVCTLKEPIDPERFRQSWTRTAADFDALRLRFISKNGEPRQRLDPSPEVPFTVLDCTASLSSSSRLLDAFLEDDRTQGFDLLRRAAAARDPHPRRRGRADLRVDAAPRNHRRRARTRRFSSACSLTTRASRQPATPRRNTRSFSSGSPNTKPVPGARDFRRLLDGFSEPTKLPLPSRPDSGRAARAGAVVQQLGAESTRALTEFAKSGGASLNTVVQLVWGLLLARCTDRDDVVFGVTWAGRHQTIERADQTVGSS